MIVPLEWINGQAFALLSGDNKIRKGDRVRIPMENNQEGVFQTAFRKLWGIQMNSTGSFTPTIDDSLAQ